MKQTIIFQRLESGFIFAATIYFYAHLGFNFLWFVLLLLTVDIFAIGYASKSKILGARLYNIGHSYIFPALLLILGATVKNNSLLGTGLIWTAHVSMDRALGYGLKLDSGFKDTHLGKIGQK